MSHGREPALQVDFSLLRRRIEAAERRLEGLEAAIEAGAPPPVSDRMQAAMRLLREALGELRAGADELRTAQARFSATNRLTDAAQRKDRRPVERRLRDSEARMRAVVDTAVDGIITIDVGGVIQSFNPAARRIFGYEEEEVLGHNVKVLMPSHHADHHDGYLRHHLETGEKKIIGKGREVTGRRKDGTTFSMHLSVSEIHGDGVIGFAGIVRDLTERKELERHLAEAAVEERRHLAQEIHDSLGGQLAGIALLADLLSKALAHQQSSQAELAAELAKQVRESHAIVRRVSRGLLPVQVDERGLIAALRELVARVNMMGAGACELACEQPVGLGDNFAANHLFRIVEEALQNAVRHAQAATIVVELAGEQDELVVTIRDDGVGIEQTPAKSEGLGLQTMRYRAGLIGAQLTIAGGPECGTMVRCVVPQSATRRAGRD